MPTKEQLAICHMFDRIAPTYDLANRLISFGFDIRWRKKFSALIPPCSRLLDVATGTGDLLINICQEHPQISGVGVDLAKNMLDFAQEKVKKSQLASRISLQQADASSLPFADESFDVVSIAFGIRNVKPMEVALKEFKRVLKPQGQAMILEFSLPQNFLVKWGYLQYFRHILPVIGGLISKDKEAYQYLNKTVEAFPTVDSFSNKLIESGFTEVVPISLSLGVATIYCARKF